MPHESRRQSYTDNRTPGVTVEVVVHESSSGDFGGFWLEIPDHGPIFVAIQPEGIERLREQLSEFPQPVYYPL